MVSKKSQKIQRKDQKHEPIKSHDVPSHNIDIVCIYVIH